MGGILRRLVVLHSPVQPSQLVPTPQAGVRPVLPGVGRQEQEMAEWVGVGEVQPRPGEGLPFSKLVKAPNSSERKHSTGKKLLVTTLMSFFFGLFCVST